MDQRAILHSMNTPYVYPIAKNQLNVRLRTKNGDCTEVWVYYKDLYDHTESIHKEPMKILHSDSLFDLYEATIQIKTGHFKYYFRLISAHQTLGYCADGYMEQPEETNFFYYPMINMDDVTVLPSWAEGEIIYQLLVDRFYDGDPSNNPPKTKNTNELPDRNTYYGGDFLGIVNKLDYLKQMGVQAIYLSPVFTSPSYHKYDISDYYRIEEIYGGEEGLKHLVKEAHSRGMKILLDGVFNHCSSEHPFFQDLLKNQEQSRYAKWFEPYSFPVSVVKANYNNFANLVPKMPRFDTTNPEVIEYLTEVAVYWTKRLEIDGWRLDVADEIASSFWRTFRRKLKTINSELLIIGEIWNRADRWMAGDQMDTMTNYKYRKLVFQFLNGSLDSQAFFQEFSGNKVFYTTPHHSYLINLIGSHDTERAFFALQNRHIALLAMALTLLLDGIPLIYYGDEYAMEGGKDPDNRRAMDWTKTETDDSRMLQKLGWFRHQSEILRKGTMIPHQSPAKVLYFSRQYRNDTLSVIVNFSNDPYSFVSGNQQLVIGSAEKNGSDYQVRPQSFAVFGTGKNTE